MTNQANQFLLLNWKNWLIQKRKVVATILEIVLPVFFSFLLIIFRQIVEIETYKEPTTWRPYNPDQFRADFIAPPDRSTADENGTWHLCYSPNHTTATDLMENMAQRIGVNVTGKYMSCSSSVQMVLVFRVSYSILRASSTGLGFATEDAMVAYLNADSASLFSDRIGGVVFNNFADDGSLPSHVNYTIRLKAEQYFGLGYSVRIYSASDWYTTFLYPFYQTLGPREPAEADGGIPGRVPAITSQQPQ